MSELGDINSLILLLGTPYVYGEPITPCALADPKGNVAVVMVSTLSHIHDTQYIISDAALCKF